MGSLGFSIILQHLLGDVVRAYRWAVADSNSMNIANAKTITMNLPNDLKINDCKPQVELRQSYGLKPLTDVKYLGGVQCMQMLLPMDLASAKDCDRDKTQVESHD